MATVLLVPGQALKIRRKVGDFRDRRADRTGQRVSELRELFDAEERFVTVDLEE